MSAKPPPWMAPRTPTVGPLIRVLLGAGLLFLLGFGFTRSSRFAGIFLMLAAACLALVLVALFARAAQRFGGRLLEFAGRSERDLVVAGLLLLALLTPWTVAVPPLGWPQVFGWQSPLSLLALAAVALACIRPLRRVAVPAIALAGVALLGWIIWMSLLMLTPRFAHSGFPFLPIDLLGEGWDIALLALAVTVDGMAARASVSKAAARPSEVWPFALVPGLGLLRLHYRGRGRLWLIGAGFALFFIQANAVGSEEFQYYASFGSLPPARARGLVLLPLALLLLVWLGSLWDTRRRLVLETLDEQSVRPMEGRRPTIV